MILLQTVISKLSSQEIIIISILATIGIVSMWIVFFIIAYKQNERLTDIIRMDAFFKAITVIGVIGSTSVLAISEKIEGELAAAILSGIVGYILGAGSKQDKAPKKVKVQKELAK